MRILLTEGSGLTSRQVASRLTAMGHDVGMLTSDPTCLCRFTRDVRRHHAVPQYADDPFAWYEAACAAYRSGGYELLFPTQEQVAVLAARRDDLVHRTIVTAVPTFEALRAVQDKVSATRTLGRLGLPQPPTHVVADEADLAAWSTFPVFAKSAIGTASGGVRRVDDVTALRDVVAEWGGGDLGTGLDAGVVVQVPVDGPLVMVQSVFDDGRLVAAHANLRVAEGARGGASRKESVDLPQVRAAMRELGEALGWHGALSADAILTPDGALLIDINPRLVEPVNAWRSGVDLVGAMVDVAFGRHPVEQAAGRGGVRTHQALLGVLGAAQRGRGRRAIAGELVSAVRRRGPHLDSTEELRSSRRDPQGSLLLLAATLAGVIQPSTWRFLSSGSVAHYALSTAAWQTILVDVELHHTC